ncbi:MAG: inositol monophosphatase [Polyangiaceae bacterium]
MSELTQLAAWAEGVAERAGALVRTLRESHDVCAHLKQGHELVTNADMASDELIRDATSRHTPHAQYFSEERAAAVDWERPTWVVDPLDGTVNYLYGHAHVGISLAYVVGGEVQLGVVHAPFQRETFVAVRGEGASLNGSPLPRRSAPALAEALISTGFPHDHSRLEAMMSRFAAVLGRCRDLRRLAAPTLDICWVATGRLDAAYETLRPWDVAAAGLIARESGVLRGHYTDTETGLPAELCGQDVAFAPPELLTPLLAVLRRGS